MGIIPLERIECILIDRNQIWIKATELGSLVAQCDEVTAFREVEREMLAHPQASELMNRLRNLQQKLEAAEADGDEAVCQAIDKEMGSVLDAAEAIPVVARFEEAQQSMNALLGTVSQIIAQSVTRHAGLTESDPPGRI
jgi:cell fate (sporulation/competence/biofilm development) regulator YlbF (YheA/YmcA/DUF963 family)